MTKPAQASRSHSALRPGRDSRQVRPAGLARCLRRGLFAGSQKQLGAAGEALFDCQMLCFGELSLAVGECFFPFDRLIARANGLIRVQVKTVHDAQAITATRSSPARAIGGSPRGLQRYGDDEFDLLAIVIAARGGHLLQPPKIPARITFPSQQYPICAATRA